MKYKFTKIEIEEAVRTSYSFSDTCRKLGMIPKGGNLATIRNTIIRHEVDISHFTGQGWSTKGVTTTKNIKTWDEIFCENSTYSTSKLRKKLVDAGIKEEKCEICFNTEWMGSKIPLETDHINGINNDHRVENLRLLCPNCHAQTETWGNKNRIKKVEIDEDEFMEAFKRSRTVSGICKILGLHQSSKILGILRDKIQDAGLVFPKVKPSYWKERAVNQKTRNNSPIRYDTCQCGSRKRKCSTSCLKCLHIRNRKVKRPDSEKLLDETRILSNVHLGKKYGVSDKTIAKWIKEITTKKA